MSSLHCKSCRSGLFFRCDWLPHPNSTCLWPLCLKQQNVIFPPFHSLGKWLNVEEYCLASKIGKPSLSWSLIISSVQLWEKGKGLFMTPRDRKKWSPAWFPSKWSQRPKVLLTWREVKTWKWRISFLAFFCNEKVAYTGAVWEYYSQHKLKPWAEREVKMYPIHGSCCR